jgi:Zn finger protein HypA/HybF involved in hydrogenase expression
MQKEIMAKVICANCQWTGRRKTGQLVTCPKCGMYATFIGFRFTGKRQ